MLRLLVIALGMLVITGCHDPTDVAQLVYASTDGTRFSLGTSAVAEVSFAVVNPGRDTVYLARCGEHLMVAMDQWRGDQWTQSRTGAFPANLPSSPLVLAPGARSAGETELSEHGEYRLRLGAATSFDRLPDWRAVSNAFTVE